MKKIKLQVQMSVDGFVGGINGELDWVTWTLDSEILKYLAEVNSNIDCILMGRVLAQGFIPHWKGEATDPAKKRDFVEEMSQEYDFAMQMYKTPKVVFSKTITDIGDWEYTSLANGDYIEEIKNLKNQSGDGDIIVYGGSRFVASLIKAKLIDELHLFINPVAIGSGMPIFNTLESKQDFNLIKASAFECGIVVLHYGLKN